jgi:hypothetical protein
MGYHLSGCEITFLWKSVLKLTFINFVFDASEQLAMGMFYLMKKNSLETGRNNRKYLVWFSDGIVNLETL